MTLFILIQLAGLAAVGQDYYGVFPLRGKLLNVREATKLWITELTIRRWTQDYKEFLEFTSSSNKECKDPFIEVNLLKSLRIMLSTTM